MFRPEFYPGVPASPASALNSPGNPSCTPPNLGSVGTTYQGPLEGKHSRRSGLLQRLHAAAPAAAAKSVRLAVLQVELPAEE